MNICIQLTWAPQIWPQTRGWSLLLTGWNWHVRRAVSTWVTGIWRRVALHLHPLNKRTTYFINRSCMSVFTFMSHIGAFWPKFEGATCGKKEFKKCWFRNSVNTSWQWRHSLRSKCKNRFYCPLFKICYQCYQNFSSFLNTLGDLWPTVRGQLHHRLSPGCSLMSYYRMAWDGNYTVK